MSWSLIKFSFSSDHSFFFIASLHSLIKSSSAFNTRLSTSSGLCTIVLISLIDFFSCIANRMYLLLAGIIFIPFSSSLDVHGKGAVMGSIYLTL